MCHLVYVELKESCTVIALTITTPLVFNEHRYQKGYVCIMYKIHL